MSLWAIIILWYLCQPKLKKYEVLEKKQFETICNLSSCSIESNKSFLFLNLHYLLSCQRVSGEFGKIFRKIIIELTKFSKRIVPFLLHFGSFDHFTDDVLVAIHTILNIVESILPVITDNNLYIQIFENNQNRNIFQNRNIWIFNSNYFKPKFQKKIQCSPKIMKKSLKQLLKRISLFKYIFGLPDRNYTI